MIATRSHKEAKDSGIITRKSSPRVGESRSRKMVREPLTSTLLILIQTAF
jgi:hypothetical protein